MTALDVHAPDPVSLDGRRRVVIDGLWPEIDCGRHPIKRIVGDTVTVEANVFADGHDAISAVLLHKPEPATDWCEAPMIPLGNDRWRGEFRVAELGRYRYAVVAWIDHFKTWARDLGKRVDAGQDVSVDLMAGADLVEAAAGRAKGPDAKKLAAHARALRAGGEDATVLGLAPELGELMARYPDRSLATTYDSGTAVTVDRELARFGAWYEFFPRSWGSICDAEKMLDYAAGMGFDVVYLPPIHPIGRTYRKGRNNAATCQPGDVGSPWAIGGPEGGHKAIHPQLGTLEDFRHFVQHARTLGVEVALDVAFQCSPDHPYVKEHPEWFRRRPDGTIQYAENPPKKYQDIYPFDFETEDWRALWEELKSVFLYWIDKGITVFRVDNPHTKPLPFWEWLIGEIKRDHPEVILLSEAFTRPRVRYSLAKGGFTQSYTYFAWRNTRQEIVDYVTELTRTEVAEFFRPNFWPNTPDILTEYVQLGGRTGSMVRLVLAATLSAAYGIYGPAFELLEHAPREPGSEEYLDSEKYQCRHWDLGKPDSLRDYITRVNQIRRAEPALQRNDNVEFVPVDNDRVVAYAKDDLLIVANLDPHHAQSGRVELPEAPAQPYQVHDLLNDRRFLWYGPRNQVELPPSAPARIFKIARQTRSERHFEYFYD